MTVLYIAAAPPESQPGLAGLVQEIKFSSDAEGMARLEAFALALLRSGIREGIRAAREKVGK